jgi:hypothetical protein
VTDLRPTGGDAPSDDAPMLLEHLNERGYILARLRRGGDPAPRGLQFLAMNIVNQLFDLADVPVEKRQAINDEADAFVYGLLAGPVPPGLCRCEVTFHDPDCPTLDPCPIKGPHECDRASHVCD